MDQHKPPPTQPGDSSTINPQIHIPTATMGYPAPAYTQNPFIQSHQPPQTYYTYPPHCSLSRYDDHMRRLRAIFLCTIWLVVITCLSSIVMFFFVRRHAPSFQLVSFSVSKFSVGEDHLTAIWDANMTMKNQFDNTDLHLDYVQSIVYFNEDLLAASPVQNFKHDVTIKRNEMGNFLTNLSVNDSSSLHTPDKKVLADLRDLRKEKNYLVLSLKMYIWISSKEDSQTMSGKLGVLCKHIKIAFDNQHTDQAGFNGYSIHCDSWF